IEGAAGAVTSKLVALVAVPFAVVTPIGPVVAPFGTVAVICVSELTVNDDVAPAKVTDEAPVKALPVTVTDVPTGPLPGVNDEIVGATGGAVLQPGSLKEPIRVFQLSCASVVGKES